MSEEVQELVPTKGMWPLLLTMVHCFFMAGSMVAPDQGHPPPDSAGQEHDTRDVLYSEDQADMEAPKNPDAFFAHAPAGVECLLQLGRHAVHGRGQYE